MKIIDLRSNSLMEIADFLSVRDILVFMRVCKTFCNVIRTYASHYQSMCNSEMGLDDPNALNWPEIYVNIIKRSLTKSLTTFMPYYTNGNTYGQMINCFIDKLAMEGRTHCTVLPENVLIKYVYVPDYEFAEYLDPANYRVDNNTYLNKDIELHAYEEYDVCPYIESVYIEIPIYGFNSPAKTVMCFSSYSLVKNLEFISYFYSCDSFEKLKTLMTDLGIEVNNKKKDLNCEYATFKRVKRPLQPVLWAKVDYDRSKYKFELPLPEGIFARHFYVLLINSTVRGSVHNIEISKVTPFASLIKVKASS